MPHIKETGEPELIQDDRDARMLAAVRLGRDTDAMVRDVYHSLHKSPTATARYFGLSVGEVRFIVFNVNVPVKAGGEPARYPRKEKP